MTILNRFLASTFLVLLMGCFSVACLDDTSSGGGGGQGPGDCVEGESYNTLSGQCEREASGQNNGANNGGNNGANNGGDNNSTSDAGGDAGGGADGGGNQNGGDAGDDSGGSTNPGGDAAVGCGPGAIVGKACAPSGEVLGGADVTIEGFDCNNNPYTETVQTNASGEFQFDDVPSGQHTLTISTGSFSRNQTIIVQNGETLDLSTAAAKICLGGGDVEIAVIEGAYDHVAGVLDDLGLTYTLEGNDELQGDIFFGYTPPTGYDFLMNPSAMNQYDIIFINCGELWNNVEATAPSDISTITSNLKAYLDAGNSLYVSDWAHPFIEKVYPSGIDFHGDDNTITEARRGYAPQTITASVNSTGLQSVLGHNQATIEFPHDPSSGVLNSNWVVADAADASATVHLHGDAQICTSAVRCSDETSGQPTGTQSAAPLLVSYKDAAGGTAIFTSFHNEHQTTLNQDMEKILKFLIFQL
jgi:hypothetical protein